LRLPAGKGGRLGFSPSSESASVSRVNALLMAFEKEKERRKWNAQRKTA
jgi:hypothetical protein